MIVLGIESSCDECSLALVQDGRHVIDMVTSYQDDVHAQYMGVVPELASRRHVETISAVYRALLERSGVAAGDIDGIAVSAHPGLNGSLVVGMSFAKGLSLALGIPFIGVDHVLGHLYAPQLTDPVDYPHGFLLVSGGHSLMGIMEDVFTPRVMGASIDDACGEAYDKVARSLGLPYPGGAEVDKLAQLGDPSAYDFPESRLHHAQSPYDMSFSGLKNAVVNQRAQFRKNLGNAASMEEESVEDIAASFQRRAIKSLSKRLVAMVQAQGQSRCIVGGGVAANSELRRQLDEVQVCDFVFPSLKYCTDNGAMIAGLGYHYLAQGKSSPLKTSSRSRVEQFKGFL